MKKNIPSSFINESGVYLTRAIFVESCHPEYEPVYALGPNDYVSETGKVYPSLHRLYVEEGDITEYRFATKYLASWSHWATLRDSSFFKEAYARMRDELEIKTKSDACHVMVTEAQKGNVSASRFLIKEFWDAGDKSSSKRGRPSKETINSIIKEEVSAKRKMLEDLERMRSN